MHKVLITVDDGCQEDVRIAKLCKKYGLEAVFFWPVDFITLAIMKGWEPLSPTEEAYISNRFEIGSHGITHSYLTQIPLSEAIDEIVESKKMLENKYQKKITKFCYPRGYANDDIRKAVKDAGYEYARSTAIGHIGEPTDPLFAETSVHIGCPVRPEYKGTNWVDYGLSLYERAKIEDKLFHAWCHSWEISKYNEWKNVEKFLKAVGNGQG